MREHVYSSRRTVNWLQTGSKVAKWRWLGCQAYAPAAFTPLKIFHVLIMQPEGLCQWKIPMTPRRIEPATFRLVAQYLNHLRHGIYTNVTQNSSGFLENRDRKFFRMLVTTYQSTDYRNPLWTVNFHISKNSNLFKNRTKVTTLHSYWY